MNKAVTDGLVLNPPAFSQGLSLWSRGDGTPGSGSYDGQPNAAYVPNDQDFGGCMELQKVEATQRVRCYREIPFRPDMYLRVTVRIKALAGNLPGVRIAAFAARSNGTNVAGVPQAGDTVSLTTYGQVRTLTAIIGAGNRQGVDLTWGTDPDYAHIGLDLTGGTGGVVRIDDIEVEDITSVFHRKLIDWVDVRDYGAIGNGSTDDSDAFAAADQAADGRGILVSEGTYRLAQNVTLSNPVRFEGTVTMPTANRLVCRRNFDLDTYAAAFGSEQTGFRKALQALMQASDHVVLDLNGRRVDLTGPVDVAAVTGLSQFEQRRVITNGMLFATPGSAWDTDTVTSVATYATANPTRLTGVANVANIDVGSLVTGTGVGREVYVRSKNVSGGTVELSQPLWAAAGTRTFTFRRYKYMLDFSGFSTLQKVEVTDIEFQCNGEASGILLAPEGLTFRMADCVINRPKSRAITSHGRGCQGMLIDQCQFLSNEQAEPAQSRTTIALNVNANDVKLRDNRVVRFATFAVMGGTGHLVLGNHFFHGDSEENGVRKAGLVLTSPNCSTTVTGNYIDNCFIEWTNEHDATPDFGTDFSFGGLNVVGNVCIASNVAPGFRWLVVKPFGSGHFINGLSVANNSFRVFSATIDRVERLDTTHATLDFTRFRRVVFSDNAFNAVDQPTISPMTVVHVQNSAASTWVVDAGDYLPFGGRVRSVTGVVTDGAITTSGGAERYDMPHSFAEEGSGGRFAELRWPSAVRGRVTVTLRCDVSA
jgi:Pectate lyase superfamily protein